jgi:hypothetical protein
MTQTVDIEKGFTWTDPITGDTATFYAKPEHGCFYEVGFNGEIGSLHAPMNSDGTPDIENVGTIEVRWEDCI